MKRDSFGTTKKCPKCGSKNILRTYEPERMHCITMEKWATLEEYMNVDCGFCKYHTTENCLDHEEN